MFFVFISTTNVSSAFVIRFVILRYSVCMQIQSLYVQFQTDIIIYLQEQYISTTTAVQFVPFPRDKRQIAFVVHD